MTLFELAVAITANDSDLRGKIEGAREKAASLGTGVMKAFGVAGAAIGAAGTAVTAFAKQSVDGFAEYEQLAGGIETLFGAGGRSIEEYAASVGRSVDAVEGEYNKLMGAQNLVLQNAENAYMTAGMSMNDYMNTAIQSAAALTNSLKGDTAKAAELMDMSVVDMSDNVNKMGTSMEGVQNAYRGFSRGNFTMLDNLALGFAGTKEGMQQLLDKAEEISGFKYDISSYSDIVQAIHVVQEEMGIAGTTQREANETISGSMNSLRSAWDNLIVGFSKGDADLSKLIGNVVGAAVTVADNVIPVITQAVSGIVNGIEQAAPLVAEELPKFVDQVLPGILSAGTVLLSSLGRVLPQTAVSVFNTFVSTVRDYLPQVADAAMSLMVQMSKAIVGYDMFSDFASFLDGILDITTEVIPRFVASGLEWVGGIAEGLLEGLPSVDDLIGSFIDTVVITIREWAPGITEAVINGLGSLTQGIVSLFGTLGPRLSESLPVLIETGLNMLMEFSASLRENAGLLVDAALDLIMHLADGLIQALPTMIETIPTIVSNIAGIINDNAPKLIETGLLLIGKLIEGIIRAVPTLIAEFPKIVNAIFNVITAVNWVNLGMNIIHGIVNGVKSLAANLPTAIKNIGNTAVEWMRAINWKTLGADIIDLIKIGIESLITAVPTTLKNIGTTAWNAFKEINWLKLGSDVISGLVSGLTGGISRVAKAAKDVASGVVGALKDVLGIHSPSRVAADLGDMTDRGFGGGMLDNIFYVIDAAKQVAGRVLDPFGDIKDELTGRVKNAFQATEQLIGSAPPMDIAGPYVSVAAQSGTTREIMIPRDYGEHPTQVTVVLELDKTRLGQVIFNLNEEQKQKHGVKLIGATT
jgi:phage-related protein